VSHRCEHVGVCDARNPRCGSYSPAPRVGLSACPQREADVQEAAFKLSLRYAAVPEVVLEALRASWDAGRRSVTKSE
jgi:hypothetical protein